MTNEPKLEAQQVEEVTPPEQPKLTKKQQEKKEKQEKAYWNSMITRGEAYDLVSSALQAEREHSRILYIQTRVLTRLLIDKGIVTKEELDELSKPVIEEIYGANPTAKSDAEEKEKEEGTEE